MSTFFDYPFHMDGRGRTAETDDDDHVRDLIYQVLFTNPGERVNRPDFGCGIKQMVFMPNSSAVATATRFLVQGALQRWLGDIINVESVDVNSEDSQLSITVVYSKRYTGERFQSTFTPPVAA
jgi:uncharacterized protein